MQPEVTQKSHNSPDLPIWEYKNTRSMGLCPVMMLVGALQYVFLMKNSVFRVTSLFGSKNRNKHSQPPGGRGTFNRKVLGPQKPTSDLQTLNMNFVAADAS